ncbi:MAG: transferrin receptor-like dimerization domain-containing protein [Thermoanaerobaculia bacterium]
MMNASLRRNLALVLLLALTGSTAPATAAPADSPMLGFSSAAAAAQREREAQLDAALSPVEMKGWLERLAARPHHVGSAWGRSNAEWMRDLFASWGFESRIETFQVLFPTPVERSLELLSPQRYKAKLEEPALAADPTSSQKGEILPTYNAYSVDGDVTAELVYVNQGLPRDYEALAERGIDVKGKIVLARYGGSWRGIKPKVAAEQGAIGCIIFSDPSGDGYTQGDVYPTGGYRSSSSVQRGSVADMPIYSGDPLTPGIAATADAPRLPLAEAKVLTKIPVLPISYGDAQPLLAALGGPVAPEDWRGTLPLTYHMGPGPARVRLRVKFDWSLKPVHDVIAVLAGATLPDEWVVRGNHHDAWVHGATDPVSGMTSLLAEAKAVGELAKSGWRPARTLVYAAWDGEEPGLIGSTEWAEAHGPELEAKAVAYLNTDSVQRGFLAIDGSHSLERFANEVARDVTDPETGVAVLERSRAVRILGAADDDERTHLRDRADLPIGALGSGSDFTPFLQHLGIASLNLDYGGEGQYGQYHSAYDSIAHYERFGDPDFAYITTSAKTGLRLTLRLAEADVVPLSIDRAASTIVGYVEEIEKLAATMRREATERRRLLDDRTHRLAADPTRTFVPPVTLDRVPFLELAPLQNAAALFEESAKRFERTRATAVERGLTADERSALNAFLRGFERHLASPAGLPGRPWYRHQIYAPGQYTGYGVKTLPAIREAIELRRWDEANAQIGVVAGVLDQARAAIDAMNSRLAR